MEINSKIILAQEKEIEKLQKKEKNLAERDYLIEFEERVNKFMHEFQKVKK